MVALIITGNKKKQKTNNFHRPVQREDSHLTLNERNACVYCALGQIAFDDAENARSFISHQRFYVSNINLTSSTTPSPIFIISHTENTERERERGKVTTQWPMARVNADPMNEFHIHRFCCCASPLENVLCSIRSCV